MGLVCPELSLDLKPTYIPQTITDFLRDVSLISDNSERLHKLDDFVMRLDHDINKIGVFKRELPLCMLLLNDAMLYLKQETAQYKTRNAHQPILEEFIPLKKDSNCVEKTYEMDVATEEEDSGSDKKHWMSSVQLWNDDLPTKSGAPHMSSNRNRNQSQDLVLEAQKGDEKRNQILRVDLHEGGSKGFVLPLVYNCPTTNLPDVRRQEDASLPGLTLLVPGMITQPEEESITRVCNLKLGDAQILNSLSPASIERPSHQQASSRKQRRCWSPELHRRFVDALTQLGGAQVATPKQIRELMRVDGLTNDEVKSHLQKYRLHSRRVPNASGNKNTHGSSGSWPAQDQISESPKPSSSHSASPEGPLQFPGLTGGTSTTGGDSMEAEDDEKSESYSWKGNLHKPGKDDV